MGYVPPPPAPNPRAVPIPDVAHERPIRRRRRNRIEDVPTSTNQRIGVGMEVEALDAHGDRWEWRAFITFDGSRSLMTSVFGSWRERRPSQYEVRGRTRDEGKAWDRAREAANDARARHAAQVVRVGRAHADRVPL